LFSQCSPVRELLLQEISDEAVIVRFFHILKSKGKRGRGEREGGGRE
jgi:hypothetical protein